ncbi:hypothetical protein BH10PLA1_BH10PLA1_22500 [soil metagenome]
MGRERIKPLSIRSLTAEEIDLQSSMEQLLVVNSISVTSLVGSGTFPHMKRGLLQHACGLAVVSMLLGASAARGEGGATADNWRAPMLTLMPDEDSVYAPEGPPRDDVGINNGGVNIQIDTWYSTDYVYRGIDHSEVGGHEDAPNAQFDSTLKFNLAKLPHPFIGVFVNVYNSDPISRFQEIRPYLGVDWTIRPLNIVLGHNTYLFPERDEQNTSEVFGKLTFDDSILFGTERPVFGPYIYGSYDYDLYNGTYFEFGVSHDFVFEDYGFTITPIARMSYVTTNQQFAIVPGGNDSGFQHYDIGFTTEYSLNKLFNVPNRFGEWTLQGECFYTDNIHYDLRADTQIWGGVGIGFKY